jgi:hypothetical protein
MNTPEPTPTGGGISGSLKIIASLAVLILAALAALLVFQVIDQSIFQDLAVKIGLVLLILAAAAVALGVLSKSKGR